MRLFFYYVTRSIKNQIRKLFKTWVAILLLACLGFGLLIGVGVAILDEALPYEESEEVVEEEEEEEAPVEIPIDGFALAELILGGLVLLMIGINAAGADKNGCAIFQPADVNILFPSPMKPQSVLLFRLMMQVGASLVLSLYFISQLSSIAREFGLPLWAVLSMLAAWLLLLVFGKFLQVLLYALCATHPRLKARLRPALLGIVLVIGGAFLAYWKSGTAHPLVAADAFFNAPVTRYIPVWGWLKGAVMFAVEGNPAATFLSLGGTLAATVLLVFAIYRTRVDFYEDAMAKSQETAELQERAQNEGKSLIKRKKERSERLTRDGLKRGTGANTFFFKAMYNRFRFAHLRIFTKTSETYLLVGVGGALLLRYYIESTSIVPIALALAIMAFFRSLGNPISDDTQKDLFIMVPESAWKKVFWSMAGGTVNCVLDLIPALLAATLILGVNPLISLAWMLFIVSIDLYSASVGLFVDLSIPVSTSPQVKSLVQILFVYFGILPSAALLIIGMIFSIFSLMATIATVINVAVGVLFLLITPFFLEYGRK
ncbi:MAG: putative ABC exporter domain-containing protein [Clostridia bacterium]|nr:putative ABC exporter domain-containing protein [Clostridia bacterium]